MKIIETNNLVKDFDGFKAIDNLTMNVIRGNIYGFLGPNGAGKTTTMRMLLGMIKPTDGTIKLFGKSINRHTDWKKVGYLIESVNAYPNVVVSDYLKIFSKYYGLKEKESISRIVSKLKLERYLKTKTKNLSLGNLQRLGLAKAMMHTPELLILDEPSNGLDPAGIIELRNILEDLSQKGTTILISSHLLTEISQIANRIGFLNEGRLMAEFSSQELDREFKNQILISTNDNARLLKLLDRFEIKSGLNKENEVVLLCDFPQERNADIPKLIVENGLSLNKFISKKEDLESFFIRKIHQSKNETVDIGSTIRVA